MKIGIDARLWNESGVGRYTRNLISELSKIDKKNQYTLFALKKDKMAIESLRLGKKWKIVVGDIRWHTLDEQIKFPLLLNQEKLDLVHFPYFSVPIFYSRPFTVTIHDLILHHFPTGEASTLPLPLYTLKLLGYKYVISQAARRAKKIITVSNATKNEIADHLGADRDKIVVIHEGVDQQIANSKLQMVKTHKQYFLYVGNAYPHKNLERLIDALDILVSQYPDISLILVGREDYFYKRLREKVQGMKLVDQVIFYGKATDEELKNLYRNAQALIVPSLMEGFGLPALEAMVNGCLVLAADIPSLREICGHAAVYFNPNSTGELAEKMKVIHYNNTYHYSDIKKKGSARVKMFSWKKMTKETLAVYESCVGVR